MGIKRIRAANIFGFLNEIGILILLLMPRTFGVSKDNEISIMATSTKEIMHLAQIGANNLIIRM